MPSPVNSSVRLSAGARAGEIKARCADIEDEIGIFAHLDHALPIGLGCDEMQAGHLRDGVADRVVEGARGDLAAMDVRDRDVQQRRGDRGGQHLVAVAEHDQNIGRKLGQHIGEAGNADAGAARDRLGAVVVQARDRSSPRSKNRRPRWLARSRRSAAPDACRRQ